VGVADRVGLVGVYREELFAEPVSGIDAHWRDLPLDFAGDAKTEPGFDFVWSGEWVVASGAERVVLV